jgi:hypothetical protein
MNTTIAIMPSIINRYCHLLSPKSSFFVVLLAEEGHVLNFSLSSYCLVLGDEKGVTIAHSTTISS